MLSQKWFMDHQPWLQITHPPFTTNSGCILWLQFREFQMLFMTSWIFCFKVVYYSREPRKSSAAICGTMLTNITQPFAQGPENAYPTVEVDVMWIILKDGRSVIGGEPLVQEGLCQTGLSDGSIADEDHFTRKTIVFCSHIINTSRRRFWH